MGEERKGSMNTHERTAPIRYWDCPGSCRGHDPDVESEHSSDTTGTEGVDVERMRSAFIRAGIVWALPADLFDEAVTVVAREYAALGRG